MREHLEPLPLGDVRIEDTFWGPRLQTIRRETLLQQFDQCRETGRLDALTLSWQDGQPNRPHIFWDSDVAKWLEAASYVLAVEADPELESRADHIVDLWAAAQLEDGYLNSYFGQLEQEARWSNLRDRHELYCAGHLIEAAVAYHKATGNHQCLEIVCRYADTICEVFGNDAGQRPGYPGHPEIELALVKLYRLTGVKRYLDQAAFFINERGRSPAYFQLEDQQRDECDLIYYQAHVPVRQQETAEGHAVRACYLYAGMADVAAETNDAELWAACRRLWDNLTTQRMYITGGIGSSHRGERFTFDYDLPSEAAYAETCAAIALVFFAQRMLNAEADAVYADVMERALYNGVLSGISLDGHAYFYVNPLAQDPPASRYQGWPTERQPWFGCACCPPNIARLLASLGHYLYSQGATTLYVHVYASGKARFQLSDRTRGTITQSTLYPWDGEVRLQLGLDGPQSFSLALRLPGWCRHANLSINGVECSIQTERGYLILDREWHDQDVILLQLAMPIERLTAHPKARHLCGKVALQRGPVVYCLEEVDNGENLSDLRLPTDSELELNEEDSPFAGVPCIAGHALRRNLAEWDGALYQMDRMNDYRAPILAIPYAYWANRKPGEMVVWLNQSGTLGTS